MKKAKTLLLTTILFTCAASVQAQSAIMVTPPPLTGSDPGCTNPSTTWSNKYKLSPSGPSTKAWIHSVASTEDGGAYVVNRQDGNFGNGDTGLMRVGPDGKPVWAYVIGNSSGASAPMVLADDSGGAYVVAATSGSVVAGVSILVTRVDSAGSLLWARVIEQGAPSSIAAPQAAVLDNGGIAVASTFPIGSNFKNGVNLLRFDADGNLSDNVTLDIGVLPGLPYYALDPLQLLSSEDGGLLLSTSHRRRTITGSTRFSLLMVRLDSNLQILWTRLWEPKHYPYDFRTFNTTLLTDGNWLATAPLDFSSTHVFRLNPLGEVTAEATIANGLVDMVFTLGLCSGPEGGSYITGVMFPDYFGDPHGAFILRLDSELNPIWSSSLSSTQNTMAVYSDCSAAPDGGVIAGGLSPYYPVDLLLTRLSPGGAMCYQPSAPVSIRQDVIGTGPAPQIGSSPTTILTGTMAPTILPVQLLRRPLIVNTVELGQ